MLGIAPPPSFRITIHTPCALKHRYYPQGTTESRFSAEPEPGRSYRLGSLERKVEGPCGWPKKAGPLTREAGWAYSPPPHEECSGLAPEGQQCQGHQTAAALWVWKGGSSESSGASETILIQTWVSIAGSKMSSLCTMENSSITPTRDPILKKSS